MPCGEGKGNHNAPLSECFRHSIIHFSRCKLFYCGKGCQHSLLSINDSIMYHSYELNRSTIRESDIQLIKFLTTHKDLSSAMIAVYSHANFGK